MSIPELTDKGLLPPGVFDCDLTEIKTRYVYNDRRQNIWAGFSSYLPSLIQISQVDILYIDGSFTTDKEIPSDIDVIVEIDNPGVYLSIFNIHGGLIERHWVKQTFLTDLLFGFRNSPAGQQDIREFFKEIKLKDALALGIDPKTRKGLLRVKLR